MKSRPDVVELDESDLQSKLDQIAAVMGEELVQPFRLLLRWYALLLELLREKKLSIARLRKMLFGAATETSANILSGMSASSPEAEGKSGDPSDTDEDSSADRPESSAASAGRRRRGHGRTPASQYTGCEQVVVTHESLSPGDTCPQCGDGDVYRQRDWSPVVRLKGQAPVTGTVYHLERLRCHGCGHVFKAQPPAEAGPDKHDPTVASVVATLRYGEGMPGNRLQRMQCMAGVPLVRVHAVATGL